MLGNGVSRRGFVGGLAGALGAIGLAPDGSVLAETLLRPHAAKLPFLHGQEDYDSFAKLANNENPYGPSEPVMRAMNGAWKYANRYGYPDGGIVDAIAEHHGVQPENVLLGAGSGEILEVVGLTYLDAGRKVIGVEPSYSQVYRHATNIRADAITLPLLDDYRQDIPAMIDVTLRHHRDIGFVYLCNPNNPTGRTVTKQEVRQLLDGIPEDVPVLIDEAYHHFVQDPTYATSVPYVLEDRNVIVARTFSKIYGLAGMRLGYALAPEPTVRRLRPFSTGSTSALVKWGGVAALADTESAERVRRVTLELRARTTTRLQRLGYDVIPSEASFFMLHIRRPVEPVIEAFRERGVLVGRPFPPMLEHLRVSVGTDEEMERFMVAFGDIFEVATAAGG